jgi:hypothetical protein
MNAPGSRRHRPSSSPGPFDCGPRGSTWNHGQTTTDATTLAGAGVQSSSLRAVGPPPLVLPRGGGTGPAGGARSDHIIPRCRPGQSSATFQQHVLGVSPARGRSEAHAAALLHPSLGPGVDGQCVRRGRDDRRARGGGRAGPPRTRPGGPRGGRARGGLAGCRPDPGPASARRPVRHPVRHPGPLRRITPGRRPAGCGRWRWTSCRPTTPGR